jgi:hypothetical protein
MAGTGQAGALGVPLRRIAPPIQGLAETDISHYEFVRILLLLTPSLPIAEHRGLSKPFKSLGG